MHVNEGEIRNLPYLGEIIESKFPVKTKETDAIMVLYIYIYIYVCVCVRVCVCVCVNG